MKRFSYRGSGFAAAMLLFIALVLLYSTTVRAASWDFVDGNAATGINYNPSKAAAAPKMAVLNGTLYASWSESNGTNGQIRVKKYANGSWVTADNNTPLNKDANKDAIYPTPLVFNNELYVVWQEVSSMYQIRISKFNGTTWSSVDGGGANGINVNVNDNARNPKPIVYNNELYVIWDEAYGSLRVKKYSGSSSWSPVNGGGSPLNKDTTQAGQNAEVALHDGKLYVTWSESNSTSGKVVWVKSYDGSSWNFVSGIPNTGLNIDSTKWANIPTLASYNNELYVAWSEDNQIRVKKYDGVNWTLIDGGSGISYSGINAFAGLPRMTVFDDNLYLIWQEGLGNSHVRVKQYDGQTWTWTDGNTTQGLNKNTSMSATYGYLTVFDSSLYAIFPESDGTANQVRVAQMGPSNYKPTATSVNYTGTLKEGNTLTGTYQYSDTESDTEGATTFKWYTATDAAGTDKTAIPSATTTTLSLTSAEVGKYITFEVTPVATTGTLNGTPTTYTSASAVLANEAPTATGVSFTGTLKEGNTLTGTYTYGDTESDLEGTTTFQWYTATDAAGTGKAAIPSATTANLSLTSAEAGKYITFEVTPVATIGTLNGIPATYTSTSAVLANSAPFASNVIISGSLMLNQTLNGSYTYADGDNDAEAGTMFQWYTADDASGSNKTAIAGATSKTLTLKAEQYGKYIIFEVTPAAASGTTPGIADSSSTLSPVGVLKGDVNGDGMVTPVDALYATRYSQGKLTLTNEQLKALDMNGDNKVDATDAQLILDIYLGKGV
ncbi:dockerin type I domain-containing protein [Paenibacillus qinlingensis]|uniref:dockerin type I domain-containing protein n=1 Tax=Paenibacillus qinlingensis TaxID=1837343 RepID=UPI00156563C2|nr:dockerin type I domain-containing protein [Paenibacillus qinlingensis]NQX60307.1 hypothetical protein [Paenibacillus qinlingensis]